VDILHQSRDWPEDISEINYYNVLVEWAVKTSSTSSVLQHAVMLPVLTKMNGISMVGES